MNMMGRNISLQQNRNNPSGFTKLGRGAVHVSSEHLIEITDIVIAYHTGNFTDILIRFLKKQGAFFDTIGIDIIDNAVLNHGFKKSTELTFTQAESGG